MHKKTKRDMARKGKQLPIFYEVTITDVAAEGKALAKVDDMVIFTQYAVPGDVVDLQIVKKKKNFHFIFSKKNFSKKSIHFFTKMKLCEYSWKGNNFFFSIFHFLKTF